MTSIKKNFTYNVFYQILTLILPLITAPYVSRVIGAEGQGIYSYTYSIAYYFMLFAMLGLKNYGNREIAKHRDNKEKLSKTFCSIYGLQFITALLSTIVFVIYIIFFSEKQYLLFYLLQLIYLISAFFDISWFFFGLEKFKTTVTRNVIIKIATLACTFLFVKTKNDLNIYIFLMSFSTLASQIALWPFLMKEIKFVRPTLKEIIKHLKPNLILFIPVIAVSIYTIMDKIMLGNMTNMKNVGLFEYGERIVTIPLNIITALGTVMLPRMSNLVAKGDEENTKKYINRSMEFTLFLSIPICLGLMATAENFVPIFLGDEFIKTGEITKYLSIIIVVTSFANVIRTQYLIPKEKDMIYIISVILGAIVNLFINIILIPKYDIMGAVIGTIFAETTVMLYQTFKVRKELEIKKYIKQFVHFFVKGFVMYIVVISLSFVVKQKAILIISQVIAGCIIYAALNYRYIRNNISDIPIINKMLYK